jgi:hypothetical protein
VEDEYFVMTSRWATRSDPAGFLRKRRVGGGVQSEEYDFNRPGWIPTTFFLDHARGDTDEDYEAVPAEEAEALIEEKLRRKAAREQGD